MVREELDLHMTDEQRDIVDTSQIDRVTTLTESDYQSLRTMLIEIEHNERQPKRERTRASLLRVRIESATRQGWGKR